MKLLPKRSKRPTEMTLVEHLTELRGRLFIIVIAILVGSVVGWFLFQPFLDMLRAPYCDAIADLPPEFQPPTGCDLVFSGPVEPFILRLKVVIFLGILVALPIILWQFWGFVTPGLTAKEKKWSLPFVGTSVALFALGAWFAFITLPTGLSFLLGFAGPGFVPLLTATRYIGFYMLMTLAFGLSFEFPVVLVFLAAVGIVTSRQLRDWRRYALVVILIAAAIVTPSQDPYTLFMMALPMVVFYEVAILIARAMKK